MDELPAFLVQRATADGSLPALSDTLPIDALFPCYDYRLAERMGVAHPIWKSKYPLVRVGPQFRFSGGHHLPSTGRPSAHIPVRGAVHHFKWRDRLLRSIARVRGDGSNQHEQNSYLRWLEENDFRLPTTGLKPCSRAALFEAGHLIRPTRPELLRLSALRKAARLPWTGERAAGFLSALQSVRPAITQEDERALPYLDRRWLAARPGRIAIVTPEILGLRVTGGISTAITALAERLLAAGHEVHVFLIPHGEFTGLPPHWSSYWEARGVRLHQFASANDRGRIRTAHEASLVICSALAESDWDVIHFPESSGLAAATLLLREAGIAFQSTQIVVTVHGPTRWHRGGNLLPWGRLRGGTFPSSRRTRSILPTCSSFRAPT